MATVVKLITVNLKVNLDVDGVLLVLEGFKPWNTILDVKSVACKKASERGLQICPEGGDVMSGDMFLTSELPIIQNDSTTLGSLCDRSSPYQFLNLCLFPCQNVKERDEIEEYCRCLEECGRVRMELEKTDIGDTYTSNGYSFSRELRPKSTTELPFQVQDLPIHGHLMLKDLFGRPGLPNSKIQNASRAHTTATVVLLAPNDRILEMLLSLPERIKSEYLIVRMSWDVLSYFFVRLMRACNPDLPLVAVTDLDPHHLDLFTFLDTPFDHLQLCYGWDVSSDPDDPCLEAVDYVDINWLGLRPSQCNPLHTSADDAFDDLAHPSDPGFYKVIRMLKVNPHLRRKSHWLNALEWLEVRGKRVLFHPCSSAPRCQSSLLLDDGFISKKVSEKDWV